MKNELLPQARGYELDPFIGQCINVITGNVCKLRIEDRSAFVSIYDNGGKSLRLNLGKAFAKTYLSTSYNGDAVVAYRDSDPSNCKVENLYWATKADIATRAIGTGVSERKIREAYDLPSHAKITKIERLTNLLVSSEGHVYNATNNTRANTKLKYGILTVNVRDNGKMMSLAVATEVARAFIPEAESFIGFINFDQTDCSLSNIFYTDRHTELNRYCKANKDRMIEVAREKFNIESSIKLDQHPTFNETIVSTDARVFTTCKTQGRRLVEEYRENTENCTMYKGYMICTVRRSGKRVSRLVAETFPVDTISRKDDDSTPSPSIPDRKFSNETVRDIIDLIKRNWTVKDIMEHYSKTNLDLSIVTLRSIKRKDSYIDLWDSL